MHIYNIKQSLKERFYGVPEINSGSMDADARALVYMASHIMTTIASDNNHYWYLFMNDIKDRDVIRFLMRRNGLRPEFHNSQFFMDSRPVFRVRLREIVSWPQQQNFVKKIDEYYNSVTDKRADTVRYIDTIRTKLQECNSKVK